MNKLYLTLVVLFIGLNNIWGQSYTSGYPNYSNLTTTSVRINVSCDNLLADPSSYRVRCIALLASATAPSIAQVNAFKDANNITVGSTLRGQLSLDEFTTSGIITTITGLSPSTNYIVYLVTYDIGDLTTFIESSSPTQIAFTTPAPPAPTIATYDPLQGATGVAVDKIFNLTFSENVTFNPTGTRFIDVFEDGVGPPIHSFTISSGVPSAGASISGGILTLDMPISMNNSKVHYVLIENAAIVSSATSTPFAGITDVNQWRFTTVAKVPAITTYDPLNGATGVLVDKTLTLTFDENIIFNPTSTARNIDVFEVGNPTPIYTFFARYSTGYNGASISGANLILNPTISLNSNTVYYVLMDNDVVRSQATSLPFGGIIDVNQWRFTTETVAPTITTYDPLQGATGIAVDKIFNLTFSENVTFNPTGTRFIDVFEDGVGSPIHSFTISSGVPSAGASITGSILTLDMPISMNNSKVHYVLIDNAAIISSATSTPFAGIADVNQWRFTTVAKLPEITTYDPLNGATGVLVDKTLTLTFDENIVFNPTSTSRNIDVFEVGNPTPVYNFYARYSTGYNGASISGANLILNPTISLNSNTVYYVLMDNDVVRSQATGLSFGGIVDVNQWRFTTETVAPTITTYDPLQGATGVAVDKIFNLTFSENVTFNPSGTRFIDVFEDGVGPPIHSFTITNGTPSAGASISGGILTLDMPISMNNSKVHYVLIDNAAVISSATSAPFAGIADVNQWRFTTVAKVPEITTYDPLNGATGVLVDKTLTLTFDENIVFNPTSTSRNIDLFEVGNPTPVYNFYARFSTGYNGASISGANLILNPTISLNSNTVYYVLMDNDMVRSQATGLSFGGIADVNQWRFTTETVAPTITTYDPLQGATGVAIDKIFNLTFSENVVFNPIGTRFIDVFEDGVGPPIHSFTITNGTPSAGASISGGILTLDMPISMNNSKVHYILIDNAAIISSATSTPFAGIADVNQWRFTTVQKSPEILTLDPLLGATEVAIDKTLTLTFDENIVFNPSSTAAFIEIYEDGNPSAIYSFYSRYGAGYSGASISGADLILNPSISFNNNTTYYILIEPGVVFSQTSGLPFSGIADINTWRFTTISNAPSASFDPLDGSIEVSIYKDIVVTYNQAIRNTDGSVIDDANVGDLITLLDGVTPIPFTASINAGKTVITVNATANLPANTLIDISVTPVENSLGDEQTVPSAISFTTDYFNVWVGDNSIQFNDPLNWIGDIYSNGYSVSIPAGTINEPTVISNLNSANHVIIEPGAHLTINSGGALAIKKVLELQSSNNQLVGNASLLNNGTLTINAGAVTKIHQSISNEPYDYFISSPVVGATQQNTGCDGGIYQRNNGLGTWSLLPSTTTLNVAEGYAAWGTSNSEMIFSGTINNSSSYVFNGVRSVTPNNFGWNLAGNPYPCAIDWDSPSINLTNINNAFYVWLNDTHNYGTYNGDAMLGTNMVQLYESQIPSGHAFWVQVPIGQTNGSLTIGSGARIHNSLTYLKAAKVDNRQVVRLVGDNGIYTDEAVVAFIDGANNLYDSFDSEKRFSSGNQLFEIFTIEDSKQLTINSYSNFDGEKIIPLGVKSATAGNYSIKLKSAVNFPADLKVQLEDLENSSMNDLILNQDYSFSINAGTITNRFVLHLSSKLVDGIENAILSDITVYNNEGDIFVSIPNLTSPEYSICDLSGNILMSGQMISGEMNKLHVANKGVVIIKVISKEGVFSHKILINK